MLQRIRDSLQGQKWLAYTVLGALALVFAVWGAYGIVDVSFGPGNHALKVNGETVAAKEVQDAWLRQQPELQQRFGGEIPDAEKARLQDQLMEAFARRELVAERTREFGYRVSDAQIHEAIRSEPAFQIDGKYSADVAKARLASAGITIEAFEADLRRSLRGAVLQNAIRISDFATPSEIEQFAALHHERAHAVQQIGAQVRQHELPRRLGGGP